MLEYSVYRVFLPNVFFALLHLKVLSPSLEFTQIQLC